MVDRTAADLFEECFDVGFDFLAGEVAGVAGDCGGRVFGLEGFDHGGDFCGARGGEDDDCVVLEKGAGEGDAHAAGAAEEEDAGVG